MMMTNRTTKRLLPTALLAVAGLLTAACGDDDDHRPPPGTFDGGVDEGGPLDEAQSAEVVDEINDGEIDLAELALVRAQLESVREYARMMIADHEASDDTFDAWEDANNIRSEATPLSRQVRREAIETRQQLSTLEGEAFDRAYIDSQVDMHTESLTIVDTRLLPGATGTALSLLTDFRAMIAEHLTMAQTIQAGLDAGGTDGAAAP